MRDELAARVHDVGVAGLPDLDLRYHVPDELQIDLGDGNAGAQAPAEGDRHVRLGFLPEVHRPVEDPTSLGLDELGLAREARAASGHVHREARDAELLPTFWIEIADLGDRGRLAQESQVVDAALVHLGRGRAEQGLRGPARLALDLLDELLDLRGRRERLLPLEAQERRLVLLVREVDLHDAAHEQRATDQRDKKRDVLAKEPTSRRHWITASARKSSDCGIVTPSALAVFRLITTSNFVGCSTGKSAGLVPLRIF